MLVSGLFALLLVTGTWAQVQQTGILRHSTSFEVADALIDDSYNLPPQDNLKFLEGATQEEAELGLTKPYKFGEAIPFNLGIDHEGSWTLTERDGLVVWRAMISSPGASSLSLIFKKFFLPPGAELYILGKDATLGAFTGEVNNKETGDFSTMPLGGDVLILEYIQVIPEHLNENKSSMGTTQILEEIKKEVQIEVESVVHGFRWTPNRTHFSGRCNIDAACKQGEKFRDQINSVGILITDKGQRYCSGALINNPAENGKQLFLTAAHCVVGNTQNYLVGFNYQYSKCMSELSPQAAAAKETPYIQSVQGLKMVAKYDPSDLAIFQIVESIPDSYNVYYAGWNRLDTWHQDVFAVHHPSGDVKKISTFKGLTLPAAWQEAPRAFHLKVPAWSEGTTEQGSSGSPIFDSKGLIVGHLHGGMASCSHPTGFDLYGRLASDWDSCDQSMMARNKIFACRLETVLDPDERNIVSMTGSYYVTVGGRKQAKTKAMVDYLPKGYSKPTTPYRVVNYMR